MTDQVIYIGTYTEQQGNPAHRPESIYLFDIDDATGQLTLRETIKDVINPSFLTFSADRLRLFAVNELASEFMGVSGGGVSSLQRSDESTPFTLINSQPTHGGAPCYVRLSAREKWLLVANYLGGVTALPVDGDSRLGAAKTIYLDENGKYTSHPHCVVFDPSGRYLLVADLGRDQVLIFAWNNETGALTAHSSVTTVKGAGPRHVEFHRNGRFTYVTNELNSTLGAYSFDAEQGTLTHIQTVSTLPADWTGEKSGAHLRISASGRFLYSSNRGHDSIAVFAIDQESGKLTMIETVPSGGKKPRNFNFDLSEKYLLVANQDSGNVVTFRVDSETGKLTATGHVVEVPQSVFVQAIED